MYHKLKELAPGIWDVQCSSSSVGVVAQGELKESLNGGVRVVGKKWVVIGYEDTQFRTRDLAVEALCEMHRFEKLRLSKLAELKHCESEMALVSSKARRKSFKTSAPKVRGKYRKTRNELVRINGRCIQSMLCMEGPLASPKRPLKDVEEDA